MTSPNHSRADESASTDVAVIYAEVSPKRMQLSKHNVKKSNKKSTSNPKLSSAEENSFDVSHKEENILLLQTPRQEEACNQHKVVPQSEQLTSNSTANLASQPEEVTYCVASGSHMEYSELDPKTLSLHYGSVTPYGTILSVSHRDDKKKQIFSGSNSMEKEETSISNALYSSLQPLSSLSVPRIIIDQRSILYADFLPRKKKEGCCKTFYFNFHDCIKQANLWLADNKGAEVFKCESVRHRLDRSYKFEPESTSTHDRSYLWGLRVWYRLAKELKEKITKLAYKNFSPRFLDKESKKQHNAKDHPSFEDFNSLTKRMGEELSKEPIYGSFLSIETISTNFPNNLQNEEFIDFDNTYCRLEFQGKWEIFFIRLFYVEDHSYHYSPEFEFVDFVPKALSLSSSRSHPQFDEIRALVKDSNDWLKKHPTKKFIAVEINEISFNMNMFVLSNGFIDTMSSFCQRTKSSANCHSIKFLRLWLLDVTLTPKSCLIPEEQLPQLFSDFDILSFVPRQLTSSGCCGANKPIFTSTRKTIELINEWLIASGAELVDIQTDDFEKWKESSSNIHTILPERTYNKEDYSTSYQSAVEYRLTVFRVYYRPISLGHYYTPNQDNPMQPCCCFVGCNIL